MAEKRMFSRAVVCSDAFLDMPSEAQCLYFQLNLASDDRGFCDCPRRVMRMLGSSDDSMKLLIAKKFVLIPDCNDQVIVIKHWRINNNMRTQRFKETKYTDILGELYYDENNSYSKNPGDGHVPCLSCSDQGLLPSGQPMVDQRLTNGQPMVNQWSTQNRIEQNRVEQSSIEQNSIDQYRVNTIPSYTQKKRIEGEYEGVLPTPSAPSDRSDAERQKKIEHWGDCVRRCQRLGYDSHGMYTLAEADGISRREVDQYLEATG